MVIEVEYLLTNSNKDKIGTNQGYLNLNNAIEAETNTSIERGLVAEVIIPLDITSIAL